jgi:hypothetical protein
MLYPYAMAVPNRVGTEALLHRRHGASPKLVDLQSHTSHPENTPMALLILVKHAMPEIDPTHPYSALAAPRAAVVRGAGAAGPARDCC